ncbi:MAG: hypothetical protein MAG431_01042 [Chloroflexi bacterium]|nr:hypothetical protein [Chloroflexota bacterium]
MSRKISLVIIFVLLFFVLACELTPPVTEQPPSATSAEVAYPEPAGEESGEAYPAPPAEVEAATVTPLTPTATTPPPPTHTPTLSPTFTLQPSDTPTLTPTFTQTATDTPVGAYPYAVQEGTPLTMPNHAHPDAGCNWLGVAGQVFTSDMDVVKDLVVIAKGTLDGTPVDMLTMTGLATAYGPGGYEFVLSNTPVATEGTVWVQVMDLAGEQLTEKVYLDTQAACAENLILLNFVEVGE